MPYQTNGVNYPSPGYSPNYNPYAPITYPFTPTYTPVQQPNVTPATYGTQYSTAAPSGNPVPVRGRVVKSDAEVSPSDIPMDGFSSYFPAEDGSCIYVKYWDKDGKIQTTKFVPAAQENSDFVPTASFEDEMRSTLAEIKQLVQRNNYRPKYHKPQNNEHKEAGNAQS